MADTEPECCEVSLDASRWFRSSALRTRTLLWKLSTTTCRN